VKDWQATYQARKMTALEAVAHIRPGDTVLVGHLIGAPLPIIEAIVEKRADFRGPGRGLVFEHLLTSGGQPWGRGEYSEYFTYNALFLGKETVQGIVENYGDFTPVHFSEVPRLLRTNLKPDVALIQVSPPDEEGYVSLGLSADYTIVGARVARTVIAEVNARCPRVFGDTKTRVSDIECFVETDREIVDIPPTKITDIERNIGGYCSELITDGACLQLGLGAIPDAVLEFLAGKKDLGVHSEIIGDGVANLAKAGVINGVKKTTDPGKIVAASLYGSKELLEYANNNPTVELYPVDYTNDVRVISQNDNVISINSCVQVDLTGQVCSEAIGPTQISGIGGQVDFVRGAKMSEGGKSIIACSSTAKNDTISKIVPFLDHGAPVTTSRADVDYIITEYGIAPLRGQTLRDRAKALIGVAHPKFRDGLMEEFDRRFRKK
jgi:4-hydroxybutyrate CoA-transferase